MQNNNLKKPFDQGLDSYIYTNVLSVSLASDENTQGKPLKPRKTTHPATSNKIKSKRRNIMELKKFNKNNQNLFFER